MKKHLLTILCGLFTVGSFVLETIKDAKDQEEMKEELKKELLEELKEGKNED